MSNSEIFLAPAKVVCQFLLTLFDLEPHQIDESIYTLIIIFLAIYIWMKFIKLSSEYDQKCVLVCALKITASEFSVIDFAIAGFVVVAIIVITRFIYVFAARALGIYTPTDYRQWSHYVPWRYFFCLWSSISTWYEAVFVLGRKGNTGGFAGWLHTLSLLYTPSKLHLGRAMAFGITLLQPVGVKISRHVFMLAMTGSGKTTALVTMIALWRGSVFVVDPKSQIVNALVKHDKRRWFVLDPHGISGVDTSHFNVFDVVKEAIDREGKDAAVLWAMRVSEALIITPSGAKSPYFYEVSRIFLAGLIVHVLTYHSEEEHHLGFVRELIVKGYKVYDDDGKEVTEGDESYEFLLHIMEQNSAYDCFVAGAVSAMKSASGETGGNVRSTLQEQTKWLDLPQTRVLEKSDVSLSDLKTKNDIVLAFTAPLSSIRQELSPLSRLLTNMLYYTFESVKKKKGSCLTVIDELPSQQYNPTLEVMLAAARSMGQTFLGIAQNVELMQRHYPKSWKSFIGESDLTFWMGGNHPDNSEMLSKMLNSRTVIKRDIRTQQKQTRDVPVMTPEQVTRYLDPDSGRLIVTRAGARALKLKNDPYYAALHVWQYAADPEHGDTLLRRIVRKLLSC